MGGPVVRFTLSPSLGVEQEPYVKKSLRVKFTDGRTKAHYASGQTYKGYPLGAVNKKEQSSL